MPQSQGRILIVDDEEGVRESFKLILGESYSLAFAANTADAAVKLETDPFDLVMLDIKMPKMNGLEFLKEIKKKRPRLPVIIVTGYESVETAQAALRNGARDYIPKPFDPKDILNAVEKVLSNPRN